MTCSPVKIGGVNAIVCHRGTRLQQCHVNDCEEFAGFACDWKVSGGTCDRPMCDTHRHPVGKNRDLCFEHDNAWARHPANKQQKLQL